MEKSELVQKAKQMLQDGYSFREVSRQLEESPSNIHRWIKELENTDGTPVPTEDGTNETLVPTVVGTDLTMINDENNNLWNDCNMNSEDISKTNIEKAKMEHEFKMAELEFEKEKHINEQKLRQYESENQELVLALDKINSEITKLKEQNNHLINGQNEEPEIPSEISGKTLSHELYVKAEQLLYEYFEFEKHGATPNQVNTLINKVNELRLDIFSWGRDNSIPFSKIEDVSYIEEIHSSLSTLWEEFDQDYDDVEYHIDIPSGFKKRFKKWIKNSLNLDNRMN